MKTRSGTSYTEVAASQHKPEPRPALKSQTRGRAKKAAPPPVPEEAPKSAKRSPKVTKTKTIAEEVEEKAVERPPKKRERQKDKQTERKETFVEIKTVNEEKKESEVKNKSGRKTRSKSEAKNKSGEEESKTEETEVKTKGDEVKTRKTVEKKVTEEVTQSQSTRRTRRNAKTNEEIETKPKEPKDLKETKELKELKDLKEPKEPKVSKKSQRLLKPKLKPKPEVKDETEEKSEEKAEEKNESEIEKVEEKTAEEEKPNEEPNAGTECARMEPLQEVEESKDCEPKIAVEESPTEEKPMEIDLKEEEKQKKAAKRKTEESGQEVPCKSSFEPVKRLRVSRFSVPAIPQICGQLFSFGEDIAGELGLRMTQYKDNKLKRNEPSLVTDADGQPIDNVVSVVCGAIHSCCLTFDGKVVTFGCNDDSALGRDTSTAADETDDTLEIDDSEETAAKTPRAVAGLPEVVKVTAGDMHTCVLTRDGQVFVWGNFKDESKKLGLFVDSAKEEAGDDFQATPFPRQVATDARIVDIASGCHHVLLLTEDGDVLSFGDGSIGQLGRVPEEALTSVARDRQLFLEPRKVELEPGAVAEKVWANHWSSFAKTTAGHVFCWGLNNNNQLGFKSTESVRVNADPDQSQAFHERILELRPKKAQQMPANVQMIANGQHHMLALDADGHVFVCGCNLYGKLGLDGQSAPESPQQIPREAFGGERVKFVACGEFCSMAITESGQLLTWGQGALQIGVGPQDGDFCDRVVPTRVRGLLADETRFAAVASGSQHTLVIGNKSSINGN